MYSLPNDAPGKLKNLLIRWQDVAKHHPPTTDDLRFDDLVGEHSGLMLIEPVLFAEELRDLKHLRVGPEHALRTGAQLEGKLYSQFLNPKVLTRMLAVYAAVPKTGEPHYWQRMDNVYGAPPTEFCRLLLPLHDTSGNTDCLLASLVWKGDALATVSQDDLTSIAS